MSFARPHSTEKRPSAQRTAVTVSQQHVDTVCTQARIHDCRRIAIFPRQHVGAGLDQRDASAKPRKRLRQLAAARPAPMTTSSRGCVVRSKTLSLVRNGVSARPGMSGTARAAAGRDHGLPEAKLASRRIVLAPRHVTERGPENEADPKNTSTPSDVKRSAESAGARSARLARMRAMTAGEIGMCR